MAKDPFAKIRKKIAANRRRYLETEPIQTEKDMVPENNSPSSIDVQQNDIKKEIKKESAFKPSIAEQQINVQNVEPTDQESIDKAIRDNPLLKDLPRDVVANALKQPAIKPTKKLRGQELVDENNKNLPLLTKYLKQLVAPAGQVNKSISKIPENPVAGFIGTVTGIGNTLLSPFSTAFSVASDALKELPSFNITKDISIGGKEFAAALELPFKVLAEAPQKISKLIESTGLLPDDDKTINSLAKTFNTTPEKIREINQTMKEFNSLAATLLGLSLFGKVRGKLIKKETTIAEDKALGEKALNKLNRSKKFKEAVDNKVTPLAQKTIWAKVEKPTPESILNKPRELTPEGIKYFQDRLSDEATRPAEKKTIIKILKQQGLKEGVDFELPVEKKAKPKELPAHTKPKAQKTVIIDVERGLKQRSEQKSVDRGKQTNAIRNLQKSAPRQPRIEKIKAPEEIKGLGKINIEKENLEMQKMLQNEKYEKIFKNSGVAGDYKGGNTRNGKITSITLDVMVDPGNPDPALRRTSLTFKPEDYTVENIKKQTEDKIKQFVKKDDLTDIAKDFEKEIKTDKTIKEIKGIGSYHLKTKKPNDIDYHIKLNKPFDNKDKDLEKLSDKIESIKDRYPDKKGGSKLNVFIEDSEGNKLNSVDLYFVFKKGENLSDNIKNRVKEFKQNEKSLSKGISLFKQKTKTPEVNPKRITLEKPTIIDEKFDLGTIRNGRFMYNPKNNDLILGTNKIQSLTHNKKIKIAGVKGNTFDFIKGWVGFGGKYKEGILHFAPPILKSDLDGISDIGMRTELADQVISTIKRFKKQGITDESVSVNIFKKGKNKLSETLSAIEEYKKAIKGKVSKKPIKSVTKKQRIVDTDLKNIAVREKDFQGRDEPFSQETFKRIVSARIQLGLNEGEISDSRVKTIIDAANKYLETNHPKAEKLIAEDITPDNIFDWSDFGQIQLWEDPKNNKLYVIAGHSRFNASKFLEKYFPEFKDVPTIIKKGLTFEQAKEAALKSNDLSSVQSITSKADRFRKLRKKGSKLSDIKKAAKSFHGRESKRIINISFLNRNGRTIDALKSLPDDRVALQAADWIGEMRMLFDELTNAHEDEMFKYLIDQNNLGTKIRSKTQFLDIINARVSNIGFDPEKSLNLNLATTKSNLRTEYELSLTEKESDLNTAKRDLDKKRASGIQKGLKGDELRKYIDSEEGLVNRLQKDLIDLKQKRDQVMDMDNRQGDIFAEKSAVYGTNPKKLNSKQMVSWILDHQTSNTFGLLDPNDAKAIAYASDNWELKKISLDNFNWVQEPRKEGQSKLPPIILDLGEDTYDVLDGKNRIGTANLNNEKEILAYVGRVDDFESEVNAAIRTYGLTDNIYEAGYILPDGTMLDLSGKNMGGSPGQRALDYREVDMERFLQEGAIRMSFFNDKTLILDIETEPSNEAMLQLEKMVAKANSVILDVKSTDGRLINKEYDKNELGEVTDDVIKGLRGNLRSDIIREPLAEYTGLPGTSHRFNPALPKDSKEFKKWFDKSKITVTGKIGDEPLKMYHGTFSRDFTKFEPDNEGLGLFFFTPDTKLASNFSENLYGNSERRTEGILPGARIYEVYIFSKKPFDYLNPSHINELNEYFLINRRINYFSKKYILMKNNINMMRVSDHKLQKGLDFDFFMDRISSGDWTMLENNSGALRNLGYDGIWMNEFGIKTFAAFESNQIKSTTNKIFTIGEPDITKEKFEKYGLSKKLSMQEQQIKSSAFINWFGKSKVVKTDRTPLVVYHGTTHDIESFDPAKRNTEGHFGKVFYFTSSDVDASQNYLETSPDLRIRISVLAEKIIEDLEEYRNHSIYYEEISDLVEKKQEEDFLKGIKRDAPLYKVNIIEEAVQKIATKILKGTGDNIIPVYLKIENPITIVGYKTHSPMRKEQIESGYGLFNYPETNFNIKDDVDLEAATNQDLIKMIADQKGIEEKAVDLSKYSEKDLNKLRREYAIDNNYYNEPEGTLIDLIKSFKRIAYEFDLDGAALEKQFYEEINKLGYEIHPDQMIPAHIIDVAMRNSPGLMDAYDGVSLETGGALYSEIIGKTYQDMGYDGIILTSANQMFSMTMDPDTIHFHTFKPEQIKSAIGNNGEFDPNSVSIIRENADPFEKRKGETKQEFELQKLKDYKEHLRLVLQSYMGKKGDVVIGRDRKGIRTTSYQHRRAQLRQEINKYNDKIEKLQKTIPQKVKLENQIDIFGMSVKEPKTNQELLDDLRVQRNKIQNIMQDHFASLEYWEKEIKDPTIKKDKKLMKYASESIESHKKEIKDFNEQMKNISKKISDYDESKALDERDLQDKLAQQHVTLKSKILESKAEYEKLLKAEDEMGMFFTDELIKKFQKAKDKYLNNVAELEKFLGKNTNLYDLPDNKENGVLYETAQIELDFAVRKVQIEMKINPEYNGTKYSSWAEKNKDNPALRKLEPGEIAFVERQYRKYKQLKFYGSKTKIESTADVAFMFRQLESETIEHSFIVHITKEGKPIIQHISTGLYNTANMDGALSVDLVNKLGTRELYFVHNHPSGGLMASNEDMKTLLKLNEKFSGLPIIIHDGIIINIKDGKFAIFNALNPMLLKLNSLQAGEKDVVELPAITFSRNVFRQTMNGDSIKTPDDVAVYLSQAKYGLSEKNQLLVLNQQNKITARLFIKNSFGNMNKAVNEISTYINRFGGTRGIIVTNGLGVDYPQNSQSIIEATEKRNINVIDIVSVQASNDVVDFASFLTSTSGAIEINTKVGEPKLPYKRYSPASMKLAEPGRDDYRLDQDRSRLEKYIRKVQLTIPEKMDPERLKRLQELEAKDDITPEEKVERKNLRKERKGFSALDPLLRRKLSTDIKNKIKNVKIGYRIGSQEREVQLIKLRKDIIRYAKLFLPKGNFMKSEVTGLMNAVSNAKDLKSVSDAFARIKKVEERARRRDILARFNKLIRSSSIEKGDPQFITWIKQIRRMTVIDVQKEIERILNDTATKGLELTDQQDEYFYLLNKYSDIKNKPIDELEELYLELATEVEAGRSKRRKFLELEKARRKELRENALLVITGGGGVLDSDEARVSGHNKEAKTAGEILSNLGTMTHSWEMILDKLSKYDKTTAPFKSWLNQKFAIDVHKARNKESSGIRTNVKMVREKLMSIYQTANKRKILEELDGNSIRQNTGATRLKVLEVDEVGIPTETKKIPLILSQNEAAHILMSYEDENLSKTFERMGFDNKTIEDLRKYIKPKVLEWAKWQLDKFYPMYYPGVNEVYKSIRGVNLPFNDKYIPIQREVTSNITDAEFLGDVTEFISIINGSLLPRISNTRTLKIRDLDQVLLQHIITMEHFKAFAPVLQDIRAVFNSEIIRKAIVQYHGTTMLKVINRFINDFARGGVDRKNSIVVLDILRSNFIRSVIGINPVVTIKQLTSFPAYAMNIPIKDFITGVVEFAANPIPKIRFLLKNSETLKNRYHQGWERDIILAMQRARKTTAKELTRKFTFTDASMMFTKVGDAAAILFGGWSNYKYYKTKALREGKTLQEAEKFGILQFELATKRTQQAGNVEDLGELQRQGSWQKLFTIFMTAPKQYFSNASAGYRNILYKRGKFSRNMKRLLIAHFLLPMLFQFSADGFRINKDHLLRAAALGSLNGILILGDILEYLFDTFQGDTFWEFDETPIGSMVGDTKQAILKIKDLVESNHLYLDEVLSTADAIADAISKPIGLPYQPVKKLTKGIMDFSDAPDSTSFLRLFGYSSRVFADKSDILDPMVKEIKQDEKRLRKLRSKAREMPTVVEYKDDANKFEQELLLKKRNSPEWKKYQLELKSERIEKRGNDPFAKPARPTSRLGLDILRKTLKKGL